MAQSQQFSPAQILQAAHRAEAEGRDEYALQFFQHLSDYYGTTPEGRAANDAVARVNQRLQGRRQSPGPAQTNAQPSPQHNTQPSNVNQSDGLQESLRNLRNGFSGTNGQQAPAQARAPVQHGEAHQVQPARGMNGSGAHHRSPNGTHATAQPAQVSQAVPPEEQQAPARVRRYSIGRTLALIVIVLGGSALAAAVGLLATAMVMPEAVYAVAGEISMLASGLIACGTFFSGLVMILSGLVARAVFQNAAAVQLLTAARHGARAR